MAEDEGQLPEQVEAEDARVIVAKREAIVIDIRSEEEFAEERIFGSERQDEDDVAAKIEEVLADPDDERESVLLVCADGSRSAELAEELRGDGRAVSSIEGGFDAWTGKHLPTAPGRDEEYEGPALTIPGAVASESGHDEDEGEEEDPDAGEGGRSEPRPGESKDEATADRAEDA